jgi:hypothetical protein
MAVREGEEGTMASGVKVVGAAGTAEPVDAVDDQAAPAVHEAAPEPARDGAAPGRRPQPRGRRRWPTVVLALLALGGIGGTVGFGLAWAGLHQRAAGEAQAERAARSFLVDLTNFDAKTVDADFGAVTSMATGPFASQAQKFFNSSIRQELQKALASSRGQIRALYVQSYGTGQATVYAVVDQLYANDKLTTPQTDVLRIVVTMSEVQGRWKVADVTVLQGPALSSGSGSGSPSNHG